MFKGLIMGVMFCGITVFFVLPWHGIANPEPQRFFEFVEYAQWEKVCDCGKYMAGPYIRPDYWFTCANCGTDHTNTDCNIAAEFYELVGFTD